MSESRQNKKGYHRVKTNMARKTLSIEDKEAKIKTSALAVASSRINRNSVRKSKNAVLNSVKYPGTHNVRTSLEKALKTRVHSILALTKGSPGRR